MDSENLFKKMKEKGASDLHLITGIPPTFRINGFLKFADGEKLDPAKTKSLVYSLMTETQKKIFEEKKTKLLILFYIFFQRKNIVFFDSFLNIM